MPKMAVIATLTSTVTNAMLQVLKALTGQVAKSGAHAYELHSNDMDSHTQYVSEYSSILGQPENQPAFAIDVDA